MHATRRAQSRRKVFRPSGRFGPTILTLTLAAAVFTPPAFGLPQPADAAEPSGQPSPDPAPSVVERAVQAFRADPAAGEAELTRLLRSPDTAEAVLAGIADLERLPVLIWRPVSTATTPDFPLSARLAAVRLLPRFGSRDAATRLIALLDDEAPGVAPGARQSLREMTGQGDGWTNDQWKAWAAEAAAWSDRAWTSAITTRLAARNRAMGDRQRTLGDEVVSLYRRLHVELDAPGRTTLLAELIRDDRAPLRDLGFELAGRDLSARTQLGPEVATAAAARLTHPDPATRARAATLVTRLVPPDAMITLTRALQTEAVPAAAEPMLLGVARWPNEAAVIPTTRWLDREDAPFGAVATALWSLAQAGLLGEAGVRDRVLTALRERDAERGGEPALKLLVSLGNEDDLARVAALLGSQDDPLRNAAANALAETASGAAHLIETAGTDPRLFVPASRAIGAHMATPDGLLRLAGLPAIDPAVRDVAILELGQRLRAEDLSKAVSQAGLPDPIRERILARLAEPDRERTPGVLDGLLLLAETRLNLGRPADARTTLREIDPAVLGESQLRTRARLLLAAALFSGDLDAANDMDDPTLDDWLAAWRRLPDPSDLRRRAAEAIAERFGGRISPEQRAELGLEPRGASDEPELANQPDDSDEG